VIITALVTAAVNIAAPMIEAVVGDTPPKIPTPDGPAAAVPPAPAPTLAAAPCPTMGAAPGVFPVQTSSADPFA
jgi:hypothetical protein